MIVPDWSPVMSVGDAHLDEQSRAILKDAAHLVESLESAGDSSHAVQALAFLRRYVVRHFLSEETLLAEREFPGREAHRALHTEITREILELEARKGQEAAPLDLQKIRPVLQRLLDHLVLIDRGFAAWLGAYAAPRTARTTQPNPFHLGIATLDEDHQGFMQQMEPKHPGGPPDASRTVPGLPGTHAPGGNVHADV